MKYVRKVKEVRTANNFNRYEKLIGKLDNLEVRIWYNKRDKILLMK